MLTAVLTATATITAIAIVAGLLLAYANRRLPADADKLVEQVNELLPQTQCAQCGFPGCRPYAEAIVSSGAKINLCPPGGQDTVQRLADLLGREPLELAAAVPDKSMIALIDEALCIGCMHCRTACPVDAIVGAHQYMHTILAAECTGCGLCLPPCPVDCISMVSAR
ncbi:MAG: electron transport complex subunit RsxB [Gammaproteobacteria bacterium]|nr:electron transport complex subunit RsxB [Gammaproteobacteria bacterium]MDH4316563.1 electron transport complex subunit RsxB [Gammaproteobacteria bacterium]MDH5214580.1 electron transport complex subunit RsxB [Gammaproteobacteria bacterium]